jgi:hypothetical protein
MSQGPEDLETTLKHMKQKNFGRTLLYGDTAELPPLKVCRWLEIRDSAGNFGEAPPSEDCAPDKLDVALQVPNPDTFDVTEYQNIFEGNVERLHVCRECNPHVVIKVGEEKNTTEVFSVWGMMVLSLIQFNDDVQEQYVKVVKNYDRIKFKIGDINFHSPGLRNPVGVRTMYVSIAIVFNVALLIVVTMWLALRAHRKVLDYFARSGALLPMVAATGKGVFYTAIWLLTFFRVAAFLGAAVPMTVYAFVAILRKDQMQTFFSDDYVALILWGIAVISSLGLATLISSISELKQRHQFLSFTYRYLPITVCAIGMALWSFSFISDSPSFGTFRSIVTSLPILGMGPVLIAPVFKPTFDVLAIHTVFTAGLFIYALRHNARWFAAHLEDL